MQRSIVLAALAAPACGVALHAKPHAHFMALAQTEAQCSDDAYDGPSADEYRRLCAAIDAECAKGNADLVAKYNAELAKLKAECERQTRILESKEEDHSAEQKDVKVEAKDVAEANKKVAELAHCRPELAQAKEDLSAAQAIPNDTAEEVDEECKLRKLVLEKEACVAELKQAESVLATEAEQHKKESHEEDKAAAAVPPQQTKKEIACQAYEDLKNKGPPKLNCNSDAKKDALLKQADKWVEDLLAEYLRQKGILGNKQDDHKAEEADVVPERKDVKEAKVAVDRDAHCPPELEQAEADLAREQGIPDDTAAEIDAECKARKDVLAAKACVDRLRKAEAVLANENKQYSAEASEEQKAAAALPPQERIVCELKAALDAAKDARKALPCDKPEPAPKDEPEPKTKSGATRAAALAAFATLLCALVQA